MKKVIVISIMSLIIYVQNTMAAIALITALFNPVTAGTIALSGLASPFVGYAAGYVLSPDKACEQGDCVIGMVFGTYLGLVLLDEGSENAKIEFDKLTINDGLKLGLKVNQIEIYNDEVEEANILLEEVSMQMTIKSTREDSRKIWEKLRGIISSQTMDVMIAIVNQQIKAAE